MLRVCFVCSGNICRSPTAEVVFNRLAADAGVEQLVRAASAGTGAWHAGDDMDERARHAMAGAGYEAPAHVARQFTPADFGDYDVVVALDSGHLGDLRRMAAHSAEAPANIVLLRDYDPKLGPGEDPDVPDPYYGGRAGFAEVLEQVERSCAGLLDALVQQADQQAESPPR